MWQTKVEKDPQSFFIVAFGSLDTNITFFILEARICLMAFIAIPALGGSIH